MKEMEKWRQRNKTRCAQKVTFHKENELSQAPLAFLSIILLL